MSVIIFRKSKRKQAEPVEITNEVVNDFFTRTRDAILAKDAVEDVEDAVEDVEDAVEDVEDVVEEGDILLNVISDPPIEGIVLVDDDPPHVQHAPVPLRLSHPIRPAHPTHPDARCRVIGRPSIPASKMKIESKPHVTTGSNLVTIDQFMRKKSSQTQASSLRTSVPSVPTRHEVVNVFCDGSTLGNGHRNASGGIGIYFGPNDPRNVSEPYTRDTPTNQKTELYAMLRTIQILDRMTTQNPEIKYNCHIYTDSEYTINCLTKWMPTWINNCWVKADGNPVKNVSLLKELSGYYYGKRHNSSVMQLHHVMAHTGLDSPEAIGNYHADRLATNGSRQHPNYHG